MIYTNMISPYKAPEEVAGISLVNSSIDEFNVHTAHPVTMQCLRTYLGIHSNNGIHDKPGKQTPRAYYVYLVIKPSASTQLKSTRAQTLKVFACLFHLPLVLNTLNACTMPNLFLKTRPSMLHAMLTCLNYTTPKLEGKQDSILRPIALQFMIIRNSCFPGLSHLT